MLTGCVSVQKDLNTDITQARSAANDIVIASLVVCPLCEKLHDMIQKTTPFEVL